MRISSWSGYFFLFLGAMLLPYELTGFFVPSVIRPVSAFLMISGILILISARSISYRTTKIPKPVFEVIERARVEVIAKGAKGKVRLPRRS